MEHIRTQDCNNWSKIKVRPLQENTVEKKRETRAVRPYCHSSIIGVLRHGIKKAETTRDIAMDKGIGRCLKGSKG